MMIKMLQFLHFLSPKIRQSKKSYHTVDQLYVDFKYVIKVNNEHHCWWHPLCPYEEARAWAREYSCEILVGRVLWDPWNQQWTDNGIGGSDYLFFATNDSEVACITTLRWS